MQSSSLEVLPDMDNDVGFSFILLYHPVYLHIVDDIVNSLFTLCLVETYATWLLCIICFAKKIANDFHKIVELFFNFPEKSRTISTKLSNYFFIFRKIRERFPQNCQTIFLFSGKFAQQIVKIANDFLFFCKIFFFSRTQKFFYKTFTNFFLEKKLDGVAYKVLSFCL